MADVILTFRVMPESPDIDLVNLESEVKKALEEEDCKVLAVEVKEVAFGLKSLNVSFARDETKGDTEPVENRVKDLEGVSSVEVTDIRRAVG